MLPPSSVVYIGCVGRDKYAETLRKACDEAGLATEYRIDDEQPTGRCGVVITGHDRSMCTDLAAANCYKIDHLKQPRIWDLVEKAKVYYVGGFHLTVCVEAIMALAEEAAKEEDKVCHFRTRRLITDYDSDLHAQPFCTLYSSVLQGST
jgi:adenosine kinase